MPAYQDSPFQVPKLLLKGVPFGFGKIETGELWFYFQCCFIVSLGCFYWIVKSTKIQILPIMFYSCIPFLLLLIPSDSPELGDSFTSPISLILRASGYSEIRDSIVQRLFSVYMIALAFISIFQSKNLTMHINPFIIRRSPTRIPAWIINTSPANPSKPFVLRQFFKSVRIDDSELALSQFNYFQFRGAHVSMIHPSEVI